MVHRWHAVIQNFEVGWAVFLITQSTSFRLMAFVPDGLREAHCFARWFHESRFFCLRAVIWWSGKFALGGDWMKVFRCADFVAVPWYGVVVRLQLIFCVISRLAVCAALGCCQCHLVFFGWSRITFGANGLLLSFCQCMWGSRSRDHCQFVFEVFVVTRCFKWMGAWCSS